MIKGMGKIKNKMVIGKFGGYAFIGVTPNAIKLGKGIFC
jgi:hypothetical protein